MSKLPKNLNKKNAKLLNYLKFSKNIKTIGNV